ncbi:MAG TPA: DNA polymerase III subunit beta [Oligoflexia bacterium]|nr:DNA polymerase III subunit beta [Oligoflexia bacterium]HMP48122.1 DNA polymerase III subunit beta [Oligoflexia bacterium]
MNFTTSKEALTKIAFLAASIAQKKATMPILVNIKLTALENGTITGIASDLEVSLRAEVGADVKAPGSLIVDAKVFYDVVKELPNYPVTLNLSKRTRLEIECGQSRFKIHCGAAEEYPVVEGLQIQDSTSIKTAKFIEMIDKTVFAVSTDETRYNINGVYAETIEGPLGPNKMCLRFVGTDGHRMAIIDRASDGFKLDQPVIIPRKGIQELKKVLEESDDDKTEIAISKQYLTARNSNNTIAVRLVDGQYPDYKQVIPTATTTKIEADRAMLLSAIKRVSLMTTDKSRAVKFKLLDGNLLISSASPEYGEASENLDVVQDGGDVTTGFSGKFLLDMLTSVSDSEKIIIRLDGDASPGVFSGENDPLYESIIMPMRFE